MVGADGLASAAVAVEEAAGEVVGVFGGPEDELSGVEVSGEDEVLLWGVEVGGGDVFWVMDEDDAVGVGWGGVMQVVLP